MIRSISPSALALVVACASCTLMYDQSHTPDGDELDAPPAPENLESGAVAGDTPCASSGLVMIRNAATGGYATKHSTANFGTVVMREQRQNNPEEQRFLVELIADGVHRLVSRNGMQILAESLGREAIGYYHAEDEWLLVPLDSGAFEIVNTRSGNCLQADDLRDWDGLPIRDCDGKNDQAWFLVPVSNDHCP